MTGDQNSPRSSTENDLLEALIALPAQRFYNNGIATYVWVLTNRKAPARRGKAQLIDSTPRRDHHNPSRRDEVHLDGPG